MSAVRSVPSRAVREGPPLPRKGIPFIPLRRILNKRHVRFLIVSDALVQVWVHTVGTRTAPCVHPAHGCEHCAAKLPAYWQGWLYVLEENDPGLKTVRLAEGTMEYEPLLSSHAQDLRGRLLTLWRKRDDEDSDLLAELNLAKRAATQVTPPLSMLDHLWRMWSAPNRKRPNDGVQPALFTASKSRKAVQS